MRLSNKQATVESSVFGSEFVAMKHLVEDLRGLRYKLRMMGVPLEGPTFVYGDNMSVINNSSKPESTLKKNSNSVCYHAVREAVAMGEIVVGHIRTHFNFADLLTKTLSGIVRRRLVHGILYDIYDNYFGKKVSWNKQTQVREFVPWVWEDCGNTGDCFSGCFCTGFRGRTGVREMTYFWLSINTCFVCFVALCVDIYCKSNTWRIGWAHDHVVWVTMPATANKTTLI